MFFGYLAFGALEECFVLFAEVVLLLLEPEIGEVGEEGENDNKTDIFIALYLDDGEREAFPS